MAFNPSNLFLFLLCFPLLLIFIFCFYQYFYPLYLKKNIKSLIILFSFGYIGIYILLVYRYFINIKFTKFLIIESNNLLLFKDEIIFTYCNSF